MSGARLVVRGLRRRYGARVALDGLDLDVGAGEITGLLGPNGAGKSTAFRLIAGLEAPDHGTVALDDVDVTSWPLHRRARAGLGFLPQGSSLISGLTAAENVALARFGGSALLEARGLLQEAGLGGVADQPADTLSGGERRRVELVRVLAREPRVLLLDEPFAGVDPGRVGTLLKAVRAAADAGRAVLLTDHAVREAFALCDRVVLLVDGNIVAEGSAAEVAANPRAQDRYLGADFRW